jgi:hypothetical protein
MATEKGIPRNILSDDKANYRIFLFPNHWIPYILLGLISFGIYFNSIKNENALDDGIIIQKNSFVLMGMKGIDSIMTKDSYYSFYRQMNAEDQLKGGRYRPLSVITFAIEQEFIGTYPIGNFAKFTDINRNGRVEPAEANWWKDLNRNGAVEDLECVECWDKNQNFKKDTVKYVDAKGKLVPAYVEEVIPGGDRKDSVTGKIVPTIIKTPVYEEDINKDGNVNDKDCEVEGHVLRHFNNVLFYALSILVLFGLLKNYLFRKNHDLAFLATLIFAIHPIHTEVVANVKSRDEILSILFIALTFIYSFKYVEGRKLKHLFIAGFMFFLALLAKEYALTLMALIPMAFYLFIQPQLKKKDEVPAVAPVKNQKGKQPVKGGAKAAAPDDSNSYMIRCIVFGSVVVICMFIMYKLAVRNLSFIPLAPVFIIATSIAFMKDFRRRNALSLMVVLAHFLFIYFAFRFSAVTLETKVPNTEILNDPYIPIRDNPESLWATKIFVLLKYLWLQIFPHPLSSDYSFNTIPFKHFSNWEVLLSLFVHLGLGWLTVYLFFKRKPIAFALLFYFANLAMVGNIIFDIGATMGERLVFHSSLGFAIGIAWLVTEGLPMILESRIARRGIAITFTLIVLAAGSYKTWTRNYDWKNDITLFCHDVETVPNSVLVLGNAGARWIDQSEWPKNVMIKDSCIKKAKGYLLHALDLHPTYVNGYLNLGLAYYKLNDLDSSAIIWKRAEELYPTNPYLNIYYGVIIPRLMAEAYQKGQQKDFQKAVEYMRLAVWLQPNNPETNYNLGGAYFSVGRADSAEVYFRKALKLKPDHKQASEGLNSIMQQRGGQVAVPIKP